MRPKGVIYVYFIEGQKYTLFSSKCKVCKSKFDYFVPLKNASHHKKKLRIYCGEACKNRNFFPRKRLLTANQRINVAYEEIKRPLKFPNRTPRKLLGEIMTSQEWEELKKRYNNECYFIRT